MQGVRNHGGRSAIARINANTPQKKTSTQSETTIFCPAVICHPENCELAVRLLLCSVKFSAKRRPRFSTSRCAAFYYLPLAADAYPELLGDLPRKRRGTHQERSKLNPAK